MKATNYFLIFLAVLAALFAHSAVQGMRNDMATISVETSVGLNGNQIDVVVPAMAFYNGGESNQVYLFSDYKGGDDWRLRMALDAGVSLVVDENDETSYLLVCAPKGLSEEEVLTYMWDRYHPTHWHVNWSGTNVPGWVYIHCQ